VPAAEGLQRSLPVEGPLDLARTVAGTAKWGGCSWIHTAPGEAWYATRTPDGPGTIRLVHDQQRLTATAWGPGAEWLLGGAAQLAGLHDDPTRLVTDHPLLRDLQKRSRGVRLASTGRIWPTLVAAILAQKVTGKESKTQLRRLAWRLGEQAPGPRDDLWILPDPAEVARTPYYAFHPLGIERKRARIVMEAASRIGRLEQAATMPFPEASQRLQALRGIGPWTAGVVLNEALGDPDAVPVGDYHLPNAVSWALAGEPRADDARMLELLEPYVGQRGRVVRLLKGSGGAPKWGPRTDVRDIREM
jgi:3-methyladenine DNA glycosylase/8-oxoguanine DNA glycosylase